MLLAAPTLISTSTASRQAWSSDALGQASHTEFFRRPIHARVKRNLLHFTSGACRGLMAHRFPPSQAAPAHSSICSLPCLLGSSLCQLGTIYRLDLGT